MMKIPQCRARAIREKTGGMQALLLIDLQEGFRHPRWGKRNNPALERNVAEVLAAFRARGLPVIHVWHDSREPGSPLRKGLPGFRPMACAAPRPGEKIVIKREHAAFVGTPLAEHLWKQKLRELALAGLTTDHCVSTTARLACDLGFKPVVLAEATATFARGKFPADLIQATALASLKGEFARVLGRDQSLSEARSESVTAKRRS